MVQITIIFGQRVKGSITCATMIKHDPNTAQTSNEWTCIILLNNIRFEEDEITLLFYTLILGTDEASSERCFISTGLNSRFKKIMARTRYFSNIFLEH